MNDIKKICNATNLKYLAVALMFLDQIYQMFGSMGAPIWLTMLGRLSFPIFLFLAADSFHYTHDRMAFLRRLLYMSWFMIIGNAIIGSIFHNGSIGLTNNAFSTFFITGIFICSWDLLAKGLRDKSNKELIQGIGVFLLPILSSIPVVILAGIFETPHANPIVVQIVAFILSLVPSIIMVEGGFVMVILGLLFYIFRTNRIAQIIVLVVISVIAHLFDPTGVQWMMVFAAIPMYFYNGERGSGNKNFFYIFYPAHIYLLWILASLIR
ncbi:TraX family protein [Streptococcus salivarius]|uniref:TraX family protein n=1 Tax=Streptococcus salivarius TaxID=1304 RepID=UPI0034A3AAD6